MSALFEAMAVVKRYPLPRTKVFGRAEEVAAVDGVNLQVEALRNFGIVGESGSGKSTLARLLMALEPPTQGSVRILGEDPRHLSRPALRRLRRHFQMVFQDPVGSLDPRQRIGRIVAEPLHAMDEAGVSAEQAVAQALQSVGLRAADAAKFPHEFSGGQRQRIAIARALVTRPKLIVADEPLSALDVSMQAQVLNVLQDLGRTHGVTLVLISHDLAVVDHMCDDVAVMYRGRIVEQGPPDLLFRHPAHPYTQLLIEALPGMRPPRSAYAPRPAVARLGGEGCSFADRCPHAEMRCRREAPSLREIEPRHAAACHFARNIRPARPPT